MAGIGYACAVGDCSHARPVSAANRVVRRIVLHDSVIAMGAARSCTLEMHFASFSTTLSTCYGERSRGICASLWRPVVFKVPMENAMIPATFATHSLRASEQLEAWRGWYGSVVDMTSPQPAAEGFRARTTTWTLAGFAFSRVSTPPIAIARTQDPHTSQPGGSLERQSQQAERQPT